MLKKILFALAIALGAIHHNGLCVPGGKSENETDDQLFHSDLSIQVCYSKDPYKCAECMLFFYSPYKNNTLVRFVGIRIDDTASIQKQTLSVHKMQKYYLLKGEHIVNIEGISGGVALETLNLQQIKNFLIGYGNIKKIIDDNNIQGVQEETDVRISDSGIPYWKEYFLATGVKLIDSSKKK